MKRPIASVLLLALSVPLLGGCDEDSVTGLTVKDLAGTWNVTSFAFTSVANPALKQDLIDAGGSMTLVIQSDGSFSGTFNLPGVTPGALPIAGTVSLDEEAGTMHVRFSEATLIYGLFTDFDAEFTLDEARRILTWSFGPTPFDFPQNPEVGDEAAMVVVVLTRA